MSLFDDIGRKLTQTGQTISTKATGIADSSKLSYQISTEERALAELYRQLGSIYYTHCAATADEKLKPTCDSIAQKLQLLSTLRTQEAAARGKRLCPSCGSECDFYQPFCYICKAELEHMTPPGMRTCPSCKQDVPQESYFCTYCGTAMPYENP